MTSGDILWLALRWLHAMAAVAWVGSAIFYTTVVAPALTNRNSALEQVKDNDCLTKLRQHLSGEWRELLEIVAFILLISGALLSFNRLSQPRIGSMYAIMLGSKIALSIFMALVAFKWMALRRGRTDASVSLLPSARLTAIVGAIVILLAVLLRLIYEKSLAL